MKIYGWAKVFISIMAAVTMPACGTAEIILYQHGESQIFYKNNDLDDPALKSFFINGVLLTVDVKKANHNECILWLGLYSKERNESVEITKISIEGNGVYDENFINKVIPVNLSSDKKGLFKNNLLAINVKNDLLIKMTDVDNKLLLKVFYVSYGKKKVKEFVVERRIEKQFIFPT